MIIKKLINLHKSKPLHVYLNFFDNKIGVSIKEIEFFDLCLEITMYTKYNIIKFYFEKNILSDKFKIKDSIKIINSNQKIKEIISDIKNNQIVIYKKNENILYEIIQLCKENKTFNKYLLNIDMIEQFIY